jgi:GNAT superfamily N-acetyltransferase
MRIRANEIEFEVREGTPGDVPLLLSFFRSMAEFEKLPFTATDESLRTALFHDRPAAMTLLGFVDEAPVAYVVYFFTFSTVLGKRGLWLEDLFIAPAFRGKGIGEALMACLADIAVRHDCGRFEWTVLDWNERAIRFYERIGARMLGDWRVCRLEENQLPAVASRLMISR